MTRSGSSFATAGFEICLLLLAVLMAATTLPSESPRPLGLDAPPEQFSAARARAELTRLLGDETPHPIGSAANHAVEARIVERLTEFGLTPQIQDAFVCSGMWPLCGHVRNIVARLDGHQSSVVALMAHYDSVANAPGAGDDGAGIATLLESARILTKEPRARNGVLFVFTDGEEPGLIGAEAFFSEHPWAQDVVAVVNLEGQGSSGPSLLLRATPDSGRLIDVYRRIASHVVASSFFEEIFKKMPNNTDLAVAARLGKAGVDFAFSGDVDHYHTPNDSLANLADASLQHHGDNVLPLVRALAAEDLSQRTPNYVYTTLPGSLWIAYTPSTGLAIAIVVVIGMAVATWRRWQGFPHFVGALGIAVLTIVMAVVLESILLTIADRLAGTRPWWPANPWPWRLIIYTAPIVAISLQRPLVRRVGFWNSLLAAWWLWTALAFATAWWLPLASHLFLLPAAIATAVVLPLAFVHALDRPAIRCAAAIALALCAAYQFLPIAHMGEVTLGLALAPVQYAPLALLVITLLPLLDRGRVRIPRRIAWGGALVGIVWLVWTPAYSERHPQFIDFTYAVDADAGTARYLAWSPSPLPHSVAAAAPFANAPTPLPWDHGDTQVASAGLVARDTVAIERTDAGATHTLRLRPAATTHMIGIAIPEGSAVSALRVDGRALSFDHVPAGVPHIAQIVAPPRDGITVEIDTTGQARIYVIDSQRGLPDIASDLTTARGRTAVPVHAGDRWVVYRTVDL